MSNNAEGEVIGAPMFFAYYHFGSLGTFGGMGFWMDPLIQIWCTACVSTEPRFIKEGL